MNDDSILKSKILSRIVHEIVDSSFVKDLHEESALISSGLLDSISTLRLVMYLEQTFAVTIQARDLTVENFDTVSRISEFVQANRSG